MSPARRFSAIRPFAAITSAIALVTASLVAIQPAAADSAPPTGTPATVTADPLPTVQINGVVWDQAIVGNRVFVGGSFTNARPAGSPSGSNTVSRTHALAYNLQTGVLDTSWAPQANAQVMDVATSPDKSRVYVGGAFTSIASSTRYRIAAFDASSGALITNFNAQLDGRVETIATSGSTVYVGGAFTAANGQQRYKVAAFDATTGALLPWNPILVDGTVYALQVSPDGSEVVIGGSFTSVNSSSSPGYGLAAVDATAGTQLLPLPANTRIRNAGANAAVWGLAGDAQNLYVTGYSFHGGGSLEGTAAVRWSDGELAWVSDCHGDSYDAYPMGDVVYTASHNHYCGNAGSFGQTDPWTFYRATARTTAATGVVGKEPLGYANWEGNPSPTVLNWFPEINSGTYTGQSQGPWSVSGDTASGYVVYGGEFTRVNATNQQGIVRFGPSSVAPNSAGPRATGSGFPVAGRAVADGTVRLSWQANADYDNEVLSYRVTRNGSTISTFDYASQVWRRPAMGYTDTAAPAGQTSTYRVFVSDAFGNTQSSPTVSVTADGTGTLSPYARRVLDDGASYYWRLSEASGTGIRDWAATNDGTAGAGLTYGVPGAIAGDGNTAVDLNSALDSRVLTGQRALASNYFTIETWVRATSGQRGRLVGYGDATSMTATSATDDRVLYIDNNGRIIFGIYPSSFRTIVSTGSIANGQWRHVVATMGADGMKLYVDGAQVAARAGMTSAGNYYGAWILGSDSLSGWPARPSSDYFAGLLDEVAVYPGALSAGAVQQHYLLGTGSGNEAPDASFTATTDGLTVSVDASASADPDGSIASYAWDFGDGDTDSGVTASHDYASPGTYTVTLTVTDDEGATDQATRVVTVAGNAAPNAAFTTTTDGLDLAVNASTSSDPDGSIASYAWDFGDGDTDSGVTASHTYAAGGTYTVELTVTDDDGATDTASTQVTVIETGDAIALDAFGRTVSNGWGTADLGGAWTLAGTASNFSVASGVGRMVVPSAGSGRTTALASVSQTSVDAQVTASLDKAATGSGTDLVLIGRRISSTTDYRAQAKVLSTGAVSLSIRRVVSGTNTSLTSVTVPGLTVTAGDQVRIRFQVTGTGPTTLRAKVWLAGQTEPSSWQSTTTDSSASLQAAGGVGLQAYLSGSATNAPVVASFDDLAVNPAG